MSALTHDLLDDAPRTRKRLEVNLQRNRAQDHTQLLDDAAAAFDYQACRHQMWNPEEMSLLHGTPIWDGATDAQRVLLNQLYWVAYYSQVVSAEIATIFFNQASAAGLYGLSDFRVVCDTLDLESSQERAHIAAFKTVSEQVERALFGERVFTWPMRGPYAPTMIFSDLGPFAAMWRQVQLRAWGLLSSGNAFLASQYLTVRGLRTLKGKMVQQQLSSYHQQLTRGADGDAASPLPSQISFFHFMDESYHFNSSTIIGIAIPESLPAPTMFERHVANLAIRGCQRDHSRVSVVVRGLFWEDAATLPALMSVLQSPHFGLDRTEALQLLRASLCEDNEAMHASHALHATAQASYRRYVDSLPWLAQDNRDMALMARTTLPNTLDRNRRAFERFARTAS